MNNSFHSVSLEMSYSGPSSQVDGGPQRTFQPGDPGYVVCAHTGERRLHTPKWHLCLCSVPNIKTKQNKTRGCSAAAVSFCIPLLFHPHVSNWQITRCVLIGQPPGAILHTLPCSGGGSYVPVACERRENSREQAGARAEAEHHLPVLRQLRASGPLSPSGAG